MNNYKESPQPHYFVCERCNSTDECMKRFERWKNKVLGDRKAYVAKIEYLLTVKWFEGEATE